MAYQQSISRNIPSAFLFIVDQSSSMSDTMASGVSKAQFVADVLNNTLSGLLQKCQKSEGVRDYFEIGVIGYGHDFVGNSLSPNLQDKVLQPISKIYENPLRIEDRKKKIADGAGGIIEVPVKFPVWFEPKANGRTPMTRALTLAVEELATWCDNHRDSYPPTVLHITDGESTDGNPEVITELLKNVSTDDGNVLVFNLHVSTLQGKAISFPSSETEVSNTYSKMLFRMSSNLPIRVVGFAKDYGYEVENDPKGFMFNADAENIVKFFNIGTSTASNLR